VSPRTRRHFSPEQKADLLRRHLVDKVPISELCNEHSLQPSVFYDWLKQLFAKAPAVFTTLRPSSREHELEQKVVALEAKLAKKDEVIAEISEEFVRAKKALGEP
jgi:transposase-like protein